MTTYTEDEIALARRGAKWCAFNGSTLRRAAKYDDMLLTQMSGALLDKCDADGIALMHEGNEWTVGPHDSAGVGTHRNRTIALLLALDAAGLLPEEDA